MITRYFLPAVAMVALTFAAVQMVKAQQKAPPAAPPVEPATSPYQAVVAGAGLVEPETENIAVGTQVPGVVERVLVKVGDTVRPGDPLFRLDDRQLKAELGVRQAAVDSAAAAYEKVIKMPRPLEVPPAEARVAEARAGLKNAKTTYDRLLKLGKTNAVSDDELTRQLWSVEVAQAQLAKAEADLALLNEGAWGPDKLVSAAAVKQAEAMLAQTKTELDRLVTRAPRLKWSESPADADKSEFKVLQVNVRPGEFVGNVPGIALIVLGCVGRLHVRVDIDENDIAKFRPNLPGVAKPRGNPKQTFPLTFVRVEPYVIPKRSLTGGNTERVDTRVLQVIYALDAKGEQLYVGQQMDVFLNGDATK
jgi:multidrug efflux pump subunit AcrA (membrane-fusion protein)